MCDASSLFEVYACLFLALRNTLSLPPILTVLKLIIADYSPLLLNKTIVNTPFSLSHHHYGQQSIFCKHADCQYYAEYYQRTGAILLWCDGWPSLLREQYSKNNTGDTIIT